MTGEFFLGDVSNFSVGDEVSSESHSALIDSIDRDAGVITFGSVLKKLYTTDAVSEIAHEYPGFFGVTRTANTTRLAGCNLGTVEPAIGTATIAVITTFAAMEFLRRRKAQVRAAEGDAGAFDALAVEFATWLRGWIERIVGLLGREAQKP